MKYTLLILVSMLSMACGTSNLHLTKGSPVNMPETYGPSIRATDLKTHVYQLASDAFEGRDTGEPGQQKAAAYLKDFYLKNQLLSPLGDGDYFQEIDQKFLQPGIKPSENVVAFIEGSSLPAEVLVISGHYDHVGIHDGVIYNGADDNASGTAAVMEIAQAFQQAVEAGHRPLRSILFLHLSAEEKGLLGSKYYVSAPVFPLENTIADLNIDMVGRIDKAHQKRPNYIYLIGSDKLSKDLHQLSERANKQFVGLDLDYTYNKENDPNRFYYRSDHYNFAKHNIPVIFYFNGTHQDYHRPTDTPDKIQYELLAKRARLVFYTAWELANRPKRIRVD